jgi:non-ribosomal peptide synthetase component E (peptide arylation enzyme)
MLPAENFESQPESGPLTAEGLLKRRAAQRPGVVALSDPPNLEALGLGRPRAFTYYEADCAVDALAEFLISLGLVPGDVIAVQLPNVAITPLTFLAAWRAGLTVAAIPMLWRQHELARACETVAPKAFIGLSAFAGEDYAERLCAVAATQLSVRFVLGFGDVLPDGVISLDEVVARRDGPRRGAGIGLGQAPAMITFTARAGAPFLPVPRHEDELLAQGAMTVIGLALDRSDVILNPYPFTGPIGLALGLMPWLIGGATLALHHPFDYAAFVEQLFAAGASVTAVPSPVLLELAKDGVLQQAQSRIRRLGVVWPMPDLAQSLPDFNGAAPLLFDLYPLGDLASLVLRREARNRPEPIPLGTIRLDEDGGETAFLETKLAFPRDDEGYGALLMRGPVVPRHGSGPLAPDGDGFVTTGLRATLDGARSMTLRFARDPELLRHGGIAIAASEFDSLYRSYPGFLDAACFVLPDPVMGDRVFAAVMPRPGEPVSLEVLHEFLAAQGVAPYKFPDKLVVVKQIPRDADGRVLRDQLLQQV